MKYKDYRTVYDYAIRKYPNVDCIYIAAKNNDITSYFIGINLNNGNGFFIPGCRKQFLHTICKEADDI